MPKGELSLCCASCHCLVAQGPFQEFTLAFFKQALEVHECNDFGMFGTTIGPGLKRKARNLQSVDDEPSK